MQFPPYFYFRSSDIRVRASRASFIAVFGQLLLSALCHGTVVLSVLSVTLVHCGQIVEWISMPFGTEVGLCPGDIVLDGDPAPHGKGHSTPHFSAHVYCGQIAPISATAKLLFLKVKMTPIILLLLPLFLLIRCPFPFLPRSAKPPKSGS